MTNTRQHFIGSSDCAPILGISKWGTPLSTYLEKIGEGGEISEDKKRFFARRKAMEPYVCQWLHDEYGMNIVFNNRRATNNSLPPYISAEIDAEFVVTESIVEKIPEIPESLVNTTQNIEIKTSSEWIPDFVGGEIPVQYCAQAMHGMMVSEASLCLFAVAKSFDDLKIYPLLRDEDIIDGIWAKEVEFWTKHVLPRFPPEPETMGDIKKLFDRAAGIPVELDDEHMNMYEEIKTIKLKIKHNEEREEHLKLQLAKYIAEKWNKFELPCNLFANDNAILTYSGVNVGSWKSQTRKSIDSSALSKEYPEIAKKLTKTTTFRVLR